MSKQGTINGKAIQATMNKQRSAMIAKERKRIEAEDKIKFAADAKRAAAELTWVKDASAARRRADEEREREQQAARERRQQQLSEQDAKPTEKKSKRDAYKAERKARVKSTAHADYTFGRKIADDDEFATTMAKYLREDPALTWAGVLVEMRKDGIAGGTKRAARLLAEAQRLAKGSTNGKAKIKKGKK